MKTISRQTTQLTPDELGGLIVILAFILGVWARSMPTYLAGSPINDGGLFYQMVLGLTESNFRLPDYIEYNNLQIPFVYPPLAFYVAGGIYKIFSIPLIDLFRWYPPLVSAISILVFYRLAISLLDSKLQAGIATFIYAFTPRAITWMIMGGGLTRATGQLFLLLTLESVFQMYKVGGKKNILLASLFGTLTVLSHPEAAVHAIVTIFVLWWMAGRNRNGILQSFIVGLLVFSTTAIWWLPAIQAHGLRPFLSAFQTGNIDTVQGIVFLTTGLSDEPFTTYILALGMIGVIYTIARGRYFLPVWFILPHVIEPRNAPNVTVFPMAMLASIALSEIVFPAIRNIEAVTRKTTLTTPFGGMAVKALSTLLVINLIFSSYYHAFRLSLNVVSEGNRTALQWIQQNTPPESKFVIVTGWECSMCDSLQEWFPVTTGRASLTTIQGKEWLAGQSFREQMETLIEIQECLNKDYQCLETGTKKLGEQFQYIYISHRVPVPLPQSILWISGGQQLAVSLASHPKYELVYQSNEASIFKYRPSQ